jgi:selenocysteine-specific elongation factor
MGSLVLVDRDELQPGEEALVQLRLDAEEPLVALPGDHFIARGFVVQEHYGTTIGGGEVIRVQAPKVRRSSEDGRAILERMAAADLVERVGLEIKSARSAGRDSDELARRTGLSKAELGSALQRLVEDGSIVRAGKGKLAQYVYGEEMARLEKRATDLLDAFHDQSPEKRGMPRAELAGRLSKSLPDRLFDELIATLVRRRAIEEDQDIIRRPGQGAKSKSGLSELEERVARQFEAWGNTPERPRQVAAALGSADAETRKALERLLTLGTLVKITSDLYLHQAPLAALREELIAHLEAHGQITPGEWKELVGASRKFTIPLAEHFDKEKVTLRVGDIRKLRRGR